MARPVSAPTRPSLAQDSSWALAGSIVSNISNVLIVILLARFLGGEAVGQYTVAFAFRAILVLVCGLGMRAAMTRFVAAYIARGDAAVVRGSIVLGLATPLALSTLVATVWFLAAGTLAESVFKDPELAVPMQLFALSLPFAVLLDNALAATQGFLTMRPYTLIGQILDPGLRIVLTAGLLIAGGGVVAVSIALPVASGVAAVLAVVALKGLTAHQPSESVTLPWRELASFASLSWVASMATQGLLWADILVLGVLVSSVDVGVYQVAARVVLIATFCITPLTASMAARVASHWELGDREGVSDRYLSVVLWCSRLSFPILAGVIAVPDAVLGVFGGEFLDGRTVVLILAVGAIAEAIGAPSSVLLNQIGRNRLNMTFNVAALVLNIGLNILLVPIMGIEGAAVAWGVTLILGGAVRIVAVHRVATAHWPFSREFFAASAAAIAAFLVAKTAVELLSLNPVAELFVAGYLIVLVYLAVVWKCGLTRVERDQAVRALTLRVPGLRWALTRWRLRGSQTGDGDLDIATLVSPFRSDILARMELFRFAREFPDLRVDDFESFLDLAYAGAYGDWFEEILVHRNGVGGASASSQRSIFRAIVSASLQLLDRYDALGPDSFGPVTVTRVRAGTDLGGWSLGRDRYVLLDGGHRVSLSMLGGREVLPSTAYVVVEDVLPPNNTARMIKSGRLAPQDAVSFLAMGLVHPADRDKVETWEDLLSLVDPADRQSMSQWSELSSPTTESTR